MESHSDFIFALKPAGFNTHAPDIGKRGLVEILSEKRRQELFVVHRLDKETSGVMLFATNKNAAAELSALFEKQQIHKKYLFLTDRRITQERFEYESAIEKDKGRFVSFSDKTPNSQTRFQKLKSFGHLDLWQAEPATGKPHQIRLHAEATGIAILGDKDHNGSPFYRLCLQAQNLRFQFRGREISHEAPVPVWLQELEKSSGDIDIESWMILEAFQRRQWLLNFEQHPQECFRLSHQDIDSYRIDMFGDHLWIYWYKDSDPNEKDLSRFQDIAQRFHKKYVIRKMLNRGDDPNAKILWGSSPEITRWTAQENHVVFELRTDTGLSPGLFLDQRENRRWVREHATGKSVMNLFSYTSGFSVNAALAGAKEVVTVDVSANFIEWSKRNFELNQLSVPTENGLREDRPKMDFKSMMSEAPQPGHYEFWVQDCIVFLKGTSKRKRKFDMIVCDPPSFGRAKNSTFSISRNYEELLTECLLCLGKGGLLLFSTNYEKWTLADLRKNILKLKHQFSFTLLDGPGQCLDFELPDEEPLMKSVILRKN